MELDLKKLSLSELRKLIEQVVKTDESEVIKETKVVNFEIL